MTIQRVFEQLTIHPALRALTTEKFLTAINLCRSLKRDISLPQPVSENHDHPPMFLPPSIHEFLSDVLDMSADGVGYLWDVIKEDVWELPTEEVSCKLQEDYFRQYGWKRELSAYYSFTALILGPEAAS